MSLSLNKTRGLPQGGHGIGLDGIGASLGRGLARAVDKVLDWQERVRQRRMLSELDDHMLHDIGLSRADVELEVTKPFWQR